MGAGQSSTAGASGNNTQEATQIKTSYYTLLSCERNATEDELKKAYRRKALELHPDRNYGDVESATKLFTEIQAAYEVLSDPQERAWYDSHEAAILRGDDGAGGEEGADGAQYEYNTRVTSADDLARLISKFNKNVEFSDSPSGFYGYLREIFDQLAKEEEIAGQWENVDVPEYPSFGHSEDAYEDVVKQFYQGWIGFSTRKTFAWKDKYRLSEAPDRQYRRAMEKENKKLREEGAREFNDAVRTLVAFVRKRDPRFTPNTQSEEQRQKILRDAAAAQAARARAANAKLMEQEVPVWAMKVERDENEGITEESESDEEHYECVACKKTFKSEKQWDAHEKSKKHQKAVYALRKKMQKDNAKLNLDSESGSGINTPMSGGEVEEEVADYVPVEVDSDGEAAELLHQMTLRDEQSVGDNSISSDPDADEDQHEPLSPSASHPETSSGTDSESENDEYASPDVVKSRLASTLSFSSSAPKAKQPPTPQSANPASAPEISTSKPLKDGDEDNDDDNDNNNDDDSWDMGPTQKGKKQGAAAKKRAKRAAAKQAAVAEQEESLGFNCASCGATFPSKTRMHQHIKDFGHAALKNVEGSGGGGGGKKKKGKR